MSSYGAHGRLEVPEIKWVRTNNYKFHTFRSVHFDPSLVQTLLPIFRGSGSETTFKQGPVTQYRSLTTSLELVLFFWRH